MNENTNEPLNQELPTDNAVAEILKSAATDPALGNSAEASGVAEAPAPVSTNAADAKELLEFAHESLAPLYPRATAIYTPEIRERLSVRVGALMDKYGLSMGGVMEQWGAEIGLLVTIVPLIGKTAQAVAADNAEWQASQAKAAEQQTEGQAKGGQTQIVDVPKPGGDLYSKA
jgi:hypothetical protein